jgi:hypothetical protein
LRTIPFISSRRCHPVHCRLEVADDGSVALALQPGEVVDADHANIGRRRWCAPAQEAQQGVGAHRHGQAFGEPFAGSAAEHEGDGVGVDEVGGETFGEDPALTRRVPTSEAPRRQADPEPPTMGRDVAEGS